MKQQFGQKWNAKAKEYSYLKAADSQIAPFSFVRDLIENELSSTHEISILDVGCFTGAFAEKVSEYAETNTTINIKYVGIDASDKVLKEARNRINATANLQLYWLQNDAYEIESIQKDLGTRGITSFDIIYFGGIFFYSRYEDSLAMKYAEYFQSKYILCADTWRKNAANAYPNLTAKFGSMRAIDYKIEANRNNNRILRLFHATQL
jgi:SAM-dependent methyltransferase